MIKIDQKQLFSFGRSFWGSHFWSFLENRAVSSYYWVFSCFCVFFRIFVFSKRCCYVAIIGWFWPFLRRSFLAFFSFFRLLFLVVLRIGYMIDMVLGSFDVIMMVHMVWYIWYDDTVERYHDMVCEMQH